MSELFRVNRGLEIDYAVRIIHGAGAPGFTTDANTSPIGSVYLDSTSGISYNKIAVGVGPATWKSTGYVLYSENAAGSPALPNSAGNYSVAIGNGAQTAGSATGSIALGTQSLARLPGSKVFSAGRFASSGDCQSGEYIVRNVSVTAIPVELFLDGNAGTTRVTLPDDSTWTFNVMVTAHRSDATDGHAGYTFTGVIKRANGVGSVAFQGTPIKQVLAESNPSWNCNIAANTTTGALTLTCTGESGKTIRWAATIRTMEITN